MPYPEAIDTLNWEVGGDAAVESGDSAWQASDSSRSVGTRSLKPLLPPVTRPEGVVQRPRPPGLPERIHVFLGKSAKPVSLYSLGSMQILTEGVAETTNGAGVPVSRQVTLKGRFFIRRSGGGYVVEQDKKAVLTTTARKLRVISVNPYNLVDVNGSVYRGSLHLIGESGGDITIVNVIGVEDYLRGVLPYELGNVDRDALEALKAQAIVARTYAYKRMLRPGARDFHIYNDVQDQVYKGVRGEYLLSDRAVWETRGMAVAHGDSLAICYYFSTCAGHTASKHEVWGGDSIAYLISRPDLDPLGEPYCAASRYCAWTQEWSQPQLAGIVRRNLRAAGVTDAPSFSSIKGLDIQQRAACGRIRLLKIQTDKGAILVKGDKVRWALRPSASEPKILPSADFTVKLAGGKVAAQGKGFGHGVGLCQVGAIGRAKAGQNFRQIIEAYYSAVQVVEFR
jgi:stage II sporulation protein D